MRQFWVHIFKDEFAFFSSSSSSSSSFFNLVLRIWHYWCLKTLRYCFNFLLKTNILPNWYNLLNICCKYVKFCNLRKVSSLPTEYIVIGTHVHSIDLLIKKMVLYKNVLDKNPLFWKKKPVIRKQKKYYSKVKLFFDITTLILLAKC